MACSRRWILEREVIIGDRYWDLAYFYSVQPWKDCSAVLIYLLLTPRI